MPQDYASHRRFVTGYHFILSPIVFVALLASIYLLYRELSGGGDVLIAALLFLLTLASAFVTTYSRLFPLKAQDRAIRAEEELRHYVLTGERFDPRVTTRQIVGLRFASDGELPELARRAAEEGLSENRIKRSIETWRPDEYRV